MAAKGQDRDQIVVNIPYEFVVAGKTLLAGTYRLNRVPNSIERVLVLSSFGKSCERNVCLGKCGRKQLDH